MGQEQRHSTGSVGHQRAALVVRHPQHVATVHLDDLVADADARQLCRRLLVDGRDGAVPKRESKTASVRPSSHLRQTYSVRRLADEVCVTREKLYFRECGCYVVRRSTGPTTPIPLLPRLPDRLHTSPPFVTLKCVIRLIFYWLSIINPQYHTRRRGDEISVERVDIQAKSIAQLTGRYNYVLFWRTIYIYWK